jgi:hypothetical protein
MEVNLYVKFRYEGNVDPLQSIWMSHVSGIALDTVSNSVVIAHITIKTKHLACESEVVLSW